LLTDITPDYENNAFNAKWFTLSPRKLGLELSLILKKFYDGPIVTGIFRKRVYDPLLALANHGRCPFCNERDASTLDHYLPKSIFPEFAILPINLIPCCKDCNHEKGEHKADSETKQLIHPYYDDIDSQQWLYASVTPS
jgi:5-methylcytosine-specific restriction endonuclease McrA